MSDDRPLAERVDQLERLVERQAETIDAQRERIDELAASRDRSVAVSRRTALKAGGLAGLLALGSGVASADPQGAVGTAADPLHTLHTDELNGGITGGEPLTGLGGGPLEITGGELSIAIGPGLELKIGALGLGSGLSAPSDLDGVLEGMERDGDGTYVITNVQELQAMAADLGGDYRLANDVGAAFTALWNDGSGFEPIGGTPDSFTGSFDGAGHVVERLSIDRRDRQNVGLFGRVWKGSIERVGLIDVDVTGHSDVGALVGDLSGTVSESYATGNVAGTRSAGGLVGSSAEPCTVVGTFAGVSVAGTEQVGGLVGHLWTNYTRVADSYATGPVTGPDDYPVLQAIDETAQLEARQ